LQNGDVINIDIPGHKLDVALGRKELKQRLASMAAFKPRIKTGYLKRYSDKVGSASTGAVFAE
jgi:dihydroxy-acid dehydratase